MKHNIKKQNQCKDITPKKSCSSISCSPLHMENKDSNSPSHSHNYRITKKYKTWLYIYGEREREREYGRHGGGLLMQY